MIRFFILLILIIRQGFSGELTGGDKTDLLELKLSLPTEKEGEITGAGLQLGDSEESKENEKQIK